MKRAWGESEPGAEASMGRKRVWGGSEYGEDGRLGRERVWGGEEYGAEGRLGRKGPRVSMGRMEYGAQGTPLSPKPPGATGLALDGRCFNE